MLNPALLGVVLAGGRSSRMGRDKASLPHPSGGTFFTHAIEQLAACCAHLGCSVAAVPDTTEPDGTVTSRHQPDRAHHIVDVRPNRGPAEGVSLSVALAKTIGCTGVLVTPVDLPRLQTEHLASLVLTFAKNPDAIIASVSDDPASLKPLQPLVAIYPVGLQSELDRLAGSDRRSLYRFIEKQQHVTVTLPAQVLHNVNSPDDLRP